MTHLNPEILKYYTHTKTLSDGRICGVHRLLFHWTVHIDIDDTGYADRYCFATEELAVAALAKWDGVGDMEGWHRHPKTGRRRDLISGREWIGF